MDLKKLKGLQVLSRRAYSRNKALIFDIVLFGSSIKGKIKPGDIDVSVIFIKKIPHKKILDILSTFKGLHAEYIFLEEIYKEPLWATIIQEGYSLIKSSSVHKLLGFDSQFLFMYDLKNLDPVSKSRFSHALLGRKKRLGILSEAGGRQLGKGCISVPTENSEKIRAFLGSWKVNYSVLRCLLS